MPYTPCHGIVGAAWVAWVFEVKDVEHGYLTHSAELSEKADGGWGIAVAGLLAYYLLLLPACRTML